MRAARHPPRGLSFGTGIGFGSSPWHRGPFGYARQAFYVPEPSIQAIYSRVLVVEALRADALPKATLEALLPAAKPSGIASKPAPAAKPVQWLLASSLGR